MFDPRNPRREALDAARRFLLSGTDEERELASDVPPRLTPSVLKDLRMSRSRERVLDNLDDMYREAF